MPPRTRDTNSGAAEVESAETAPRPVDPEVPVVMPDSDEETVETALGPIEAKRGKLSFEPVKNSVGDYPERPFGDAITDEHRKFLEDSGVEVEAKTKDAKDA